MTYIEDYVNRLRQIQAAQALGSMPQPTVSRSQIANLILQKSRAETPVTMPPAMEAEKKPGHGIGSMALHVLDILSRPSYAVANAADEAFNKEHGGSPGDVLKAAGRGLKGEDQTSFVDVLQHQYENDTYDDPEYQRILKDYGANEAEWYRQTQVKRAQTDPKAIIGGTIADFVYDPLNLVGAGLVVKPIKAVSKALKGAEKADELVSAGEEVARQVPTSAMPEASQAIPSAVPSEPTPSLSQGLIDQLRSANQGVSNTPTNITAKNLKLTPSLGGGYVPGFGQTKVKPGMVAPITKVAPNHVPIVDAIIQKYAGKAIDEQKLRTDIEQAIRAYQPPGKTNAWGTGGLVSGEYITSIQDAVIKALQQSPTAQQIPFPTVEGKFGSNRRPPVKTIEGQAVQADYSAPNLEKPARYANLSDVFNRDLRQKDFESLQKARNTNETAQVVDQVSKSNPAAIHLVTNKNINPLSPVARNSVDKAVQETVREIAESVADPAKAKALGKQPRHPVFNAPTQNNLSSKLANAARNQLKAEGFATGGKITNPAAPRFIPAVYERYVDMLRNAEESLVTKGRDELNDAFYPRGGIKPNSPYLRLSDVLTALPRELAIKTIFGPRTVDKVHPSILLKAVTGNNAALGKIAKRNPDLFKAIQSTDWSPLMVKEHATRIIDAANAAHKTTDDAAKLISDASGSTSSDTAKAGFIDAVVKGGKKEFAKEMPEAKSSVNDMLDGLRKSIPNPVPNITEDIIQRGKDKLAAGVFSSGNGQKVAQGPRIEAAKATVEEITQMPAREAGQSMVAADQAADGIFSTVLNWIDPAAGYKTLRPVLLKNISVRRSSATTRAHEIIKTFNKVPEAEHMHFWEEVKGTIPPVASHLSAVEDMKKLIGNMFGESGLAEHFAGKTSIARAGINIDHLNKHLQIVGIKDFKFIRDVPDPLTGKNLRLDGPQILGTWRNYVPKNSKDLRIFVFNLTQATENSMVDYSTWANVASLYARKKPGMGLVQVSGMHPAIDGMHVPTDIAPQLGKLARGLDEMFEPVSSGSKFWKMYDQGLRTWKTGVTIYSPSHHIRNMVGDMFMSWMDGLNNPLYYSKAASLLKANAHRYSDIKVGKNPLSDILGEGREAAIIGKIVGQTKDRIPKGTRIIAKAQVGNKRFPITIDQAYQMAFRQGILPHSSVIEDLPGSETLAETLANRFHPGKAGVFAPAKGKVATGVKQLSETREHYVRLAHWLYALDNTKANSLEDLFQKAGDRVRKYHPDGLDLTMTEKRVFRRVMPFYSWTRKAIPLVLEGLVMHPAKIMAYPKIMSAIQESQGIDSSVSDPWPDDQLFPNWLASNVIGPTISPTSAFARAIARDNSSVGYGVVDPQLPATQLMEDFGNNPIKGVANMVTPFAKIPAEIATGHQVQTGAPIGDKTEYIDKNIPLLSTLSRLTNGAVGTGLAQGGDLKGKETKPYNPASLINYLTGAGIIDTGRYIKGGEFDLRERMRKEKENGAK